MCVALLTRNSFFFLYCSLPSVHVNQHLSRCCSPALLNCSNLQFATEHLRNTAYLLCSQLVYSAATSSPLYSIHSIPFKCFNLNLLVLISFLSMRLCSVRLRGAPALPRIRYIQVSARRGQFGSGGEGLSHLLPSTSSLFREYSRTN